MSALLIILHVMVCLILIIAVLLQSGKAADLAGAFGGVGSQTAFGPRGATTLLAKITTGAAVVFMLTSIGLWLVSIRGEKSVMRAVPSVTEPQKQTEESKKEPVEKKESPANTEQKKEDNKSAKSEAEK